MIPLKYKSGSRRASPFKTKCQSALDSGPVRLWLRHDEYRNEWFKSISKSSGDPLKGSALASRECFYLLSRKRTVSSAFPRVRGYHPAIAFKKAEMNNKSMQAWQNFCVI